MNGSDRKIAGGRGRGRGRSNDANQANVPSNPWSTRATRDAGRNPGRTQDSSKYTTNEKPGRKSTNEEWEKRESASAGRLAVVKKIKQSAAEHFENLVEDSDSSDEELKDEEIIKNAIKSYKDQFADDSEVPEASQCLTDLLQSGATTCPVCIDPVKHLDAVWSCILCHGMFHLQCIQRWAGQSIGVQKIAADTNDSDVNLLWCCPNCRNEYSQAECPSKYLCFCAKEENPKFDPWSIPHSCGRECFKALTPDCGHDCLLLCHPGPCPPCPKTVKIKCYCGKNGPSVRRCSKKEWSCASTCGKLLSCGHHRCKNPCHAGECLPCPEKGLQLCLCQKNKSMRSCAEPVWECKEICDEVLSCDNHTCEKSCHGGDCGPCPRTGLRFCPCGKNSVQLPCTEDVLPCEDTCGKLLECGSHYCHRGCHFGPCETCRQIVTKKCRCGKRSKEIPCCQVLTCEIKCTQLRNCERHPCKRKCCDGNCPQCEQVCNRMLSCRNHKCPAQCHTGLCFPCPLKKTVTCFCGNASISVKCGAERRTKPPKCKQLCRIPPSCHHEKREAHRCHFGVCPPCNQICNFPLTSCGHVCAENCHDHIALEKPKKLNLPVWERKPQSQEEFIPRPCAPCQYPMLRECYGKHEISTFPCSKDRPFSCRRACSRNLSCANHTCPRECHVVTASPSGKQAGKECQTCEEHCLKSRPKGCTHDCKLPCHPGDCPKCFKFMRVKCHCELMMIDVKCSVLTGGDAARLSADKSCKNQCPKALPCGHRCPLVCHPDACADPVKCSQKTKLHCPCKRKKKERLCGGAGSAGIPLDCDDKCRELSESKKREEEKKEEAIKAEELKKQQDELELFQRKKQGRKRKHKPVQQEKQENLLQKYGKWVIIPLIVVLISLTYFSMFSN